MEAVHSVALEVEGPIENGVIFAIIHIIIP
jgi:hypothetical protein